MDKQFVSAIKATFLTLACVSIVACSSSSSNSSSTTSPAGSSSASKPSKPSDALKFNDLRYSSADSKIVAGNSSATANEAGTVIDLVVDLDGKKHSVRLHADDEYKDLFYDKTGRWEVAPFQGHLSEADYDQPLTNPFEHMLLGYWLKADVDIRENYDEVLDSFDLGTFVSGEQTAVSDLPSGTISYIGWYEAGDINELYNSDYLDNWLQGDAELTADFGASSVVLDLKNLTQFEGVISDNRFAGQNSSGRMNGGFFGPNAAEAGGSFSHEKDDVNYIGLFGVQKQSK